MTAAQAAPAPAPVEARSSEAQSRKSWSGWSTIDLPVFLAALLVLMLPNASGGGGRLLNLAPYGWMLIVVFAIPVSTAKRAAEAGAPLATQLPRLLAPLAVIGILISLALNERDAIGSSGQVHLTFLTLLASVLALAGLGRLLRGPGRELRVRIASSELMGRLRLLELAWCALGILGLALPWIPWPGSELDGASAAQLILRPDRGYELLPGLGAGTLLAACGVTLLTLRGMSLMRVENAAAFILGSSALGITLIGAEAQGFGPGRIATCLAATLLILTAAVGWWLAGGLLRSTDAT